MVNVTTQYNSKIFYGYGMTQDCAIHSRVIGGKVRKVFKFEK